MPCIPIDIDREKLTIMGAQFPDLQTMEEISRGIMSNVYEGFVPDKRSVEIIRDYCLDKITLQEMLQVTKEYVHGIQV
jgi:hypothetical protein